MIKMINIWHLNLQRIHIWTNWVHYNTCRHNSRYRYHLQIDSSRLHLFAGIDHGFLLVMTCNLIRCVSCHCLKVDSFWNSAITFGSFQFQQLSQHSLSSLMRGQFTLHTMLSFQRVTAQIVWQDSCFYSIFKNIQQPLAWLIYKHLI